VKNLVRYVLPKEPLPEYDPREYSIIWYPLKLLEYNIKRKKYKYLFDAYLAKKTSKKDIYVLMIRNPHHMRFSEEKPFEAITINHLATGEEILTSLLGFRHEIDRMEENLYEDLISDQTKLAIGSSILFTSPQMLREYDIKSLYYSSLLIAKEILRKIGIKRGDERIKILKEENVYYPLLISNDLEEVIEIALTDQPSKSLTELLKIKEIRSIFEEILINIYRKCEARRGLRFA